MPARKPPRRATPKAEPPVFDSAGGISKEEAERVGQYIMTLTARLGKAPSARDIVKDAERAGSPLHSFFEWDDAKAAQRFRLQQAQILLNKIRIIFTDQQGAEQSVKAFFGLRSPTLDETTPRKRYYDFATVWETAAMRDEVIADAKRRMEFWIANFHTIEILAESVRIARRALKKIPV